MDYDKIKQQLIDGISYKTIAEELGIPKSTLTSRCITYGIRAKELTKTDSTERKCTKCAIIKNIDQYYIKKTGKPTAYCKECTNQLSLDRKRKLKLDCLEYKGSKCEICGYNKCAGALHFHHLDPTIKDFGISEVRSYTLNDIIKAELDKCQVLCSNCHAEQHYYLSSGR